MLSIAPTRTGKGRGLILPNLLHLPNHSVFVIDPKGENALVSAQYRRDRLGNNVLIFNPYRIFEKEFNDLGFKQFQTFNPLANLSPESPNFADDVANIAEALIYEETRGDSHWVQSARGYVEFLIMHLVTDPEEQANQTVTLGRLRQIIAGGYSGLIVEENESGMSIIKKAAKSTCPLVRDNAGRYAVGSAEVHGLIATAETQTRIFKSEAICAALEGEKFNFEEMKNRKTSVYLILPSARLITQARYLRLVLLMAMSQFMCSEKGAHQVVMMLDEFANLGELNIIANGYGLIAGHGVTLWSFVQNLTQLQQLYPNNWETFIANSSVVTVSNVNDDTTAEYFRRRAGQCEKEKVTHNNVGTSCIGPDGNTYYPGSTTSITLAREDNLPVSTLYDAWPDDLHLFYGGQSKPTICQKLFYDQEMPFKERATPNPMNVHYRWAAPNTTTRTLGIAC
ncbi:MAG: type IV secretory system conjugative DNA transfer family protein [Methylobacter sp.]